MMFSFPAALVYGIVGIIHDSQKWLAITTTIIVGGLILLYLFKAGLLTICR
ncbi:MAG: hypothetical protein ACYSWW_15475 [Planctomycetota bacterium]